MTTLPTTSVFVWRSMMPSDCRVWCLHCRHEVTVARGYGMQHAHVVDATGISLGCMVCYLSEVTEIPIGREREWFAAYRLGGWEAVKDLWREHFER